MKLKLVIYFLVVAGIFQSCIKDDFVDDLAEPELRISSTIDTIALNTSVQFTAMYLNNVGAEEQVNLSWSSSDPTIISITSDGLAEGLQVGECYIIVEYDNGNGMLKDSILVNVGQTTTMMMQMFAGTVQTTSSYKLSGDFTLEEENQVLTLSFDNNYEASTALPGLYVYLSNNRNTIANAYEIGRVEVFSGAHSYDISDVGINDYSYVLYFCKPFNVKVGDGQIQ